ncbi:hypothetical protein [Pectobacterium carotovorum]|uniref:hypothetical protein n=1 Tax=Pectobacterium carotovorum TaxID=554 RepID=UPI000907BAAB|nr:hypothetical protein [Pectobacterium carotovorum]SHG09240.1 hypothetical protein SAMN05444147_101372 [Pectobacterium carotovorum]
MINFGDRLKKLKDRRQGSAQLFALNSGNESFSSFYDSRPNEFYENVRESDSIKYVIGAMAPVNPTSTNVSIQEGERVANTLISMLNTSGISTEFKLQGSVALDIHIEGHSDVDMLILKKDVLLVQQPILSSTSYIDAPDKRDMITQVKEIRLVSEEKLTSRYHQANVNCSNRKSISISGGSLARKVDIVPGCWFDTHDYQRSRQQHDRIVKIYDKSEHKFIENRPFLHIKKVEDKDQYYSGNLKKIVRLMKNIVADMPDYKKNKAKKLSSFDLTSIAYHMDEKLNCSEYLPLLLVERLHIWLEKLIDDKHLRDSLLVPDATRAVFNNDEKNEALDILSNEVSDLFSSIYQDIYPNDFTKDVSKLITKSIVTGFS